MACGWCCRANISGITGDSYKGLDRTWPADHRGFRALFTDGWYLDSSQGSVGDWQTPYAKDPLTNATCTYGAAHPRGNCSCVCPEHSYRDGQCHCVDGHCGATDSVYWRVFASSTKQNHGNWKKVRRHTQKIA